jgi:hypothetical protein
MYRDTVLLTTPASIKERKIIRMQSRNCLAGTWMTEKFFAAIPYSCHDEILDANVSAQSRMVNFTMTSDRIMSKSKDLEGIRVPAYENRVHSPD